MTTIRFDAWTATLGGRRLAIAIDDQTVALARGEGTDVDAWHAAIDQDGQATLAGGAMFENHVTGDVGTLRL